jgi:hypothetical protein
VRKYQYWYHIDIRLNLFGYEASYMVYRPE